MKRVGKWLFVFVLLVGIPLTIYAVKQQQILKQQAMQPEQINAPVKQQAFTGKPIEVSFAQPNTPTPLTTISTTVGKVVTFDVYVNTDTTTINGFDISITPNENLKLQEIKEGVDGQKFSTAIFNDLQKERFAKVTLNSKAIPTGMLHLATLTFLAKKKGEGKLQIGHATFTSLQSTSALPMNLPVVSYTVQ